MPTLSNRLIAEFVGTLALITLGAGSILVGAPGGLVGVAFAHGLAIAVMVTSVGHISGGHFNPAVTFGMLITKQIEVMNAVWYWVAQLAGGAVGALALMWTFPNAMNELETVVPTLGAGMSVSTGIALEAIMTFFLVWVVFAVAVDKDGAFGKVAGMPIGFTIVADILMGGPLTGGAMNPARWFGPAVVAGKWTDSIVWIAGPLIGASVAALLYMWGIARRTETV